MNAGNNHVHTQTSLFFIPHSLATAFQNRAGEGGEWVMGMEAGGGEMVQEVVQNYPKHTFH